MIARTVLALALVRLVVACGAECDDQLLRDKVDAYCTELAEDLEAAARAAAAPAGRTRNPEPVNERVAWLASPDYFKRRPAQWYVHRRFALCRDVRTYYDPSDRFYTYDRALFWVDDPRAHAISYAEKAEVVRELIRVPFRRD